MEKCTFTKAINELSKYRTGKINNNNNNNNNQAWFAFDRFSHFTKSYGTILNSFSWPRSGAEQDVMNNIHNAVRVNFNQWGWSLFLVLLVINTSVISLIADCLFFKQLLTFNVDSIKCPQQERKPFVYILHFVGLLIIPRFVVFKFQSVFTLFRPSKAI